MGWFGGASLTQEEESTIDSLMDQFAQVSHKEEFDIPQGYNQYQI